MQLDAILGMLNSSERVNLSDEDVPNLPFNDVEDFFAFNKQLRTCKNTKEKLVRLVVLLCQI